MLTLITRPIACTGCRICEQWCSTSHTGAVNPARARLHIRRDHEHYLSAPVICQGCDDPACIDACATEAITRHPVTGGLLLNEEDCLLCGACVASCVTGVLRLDPVTEMPLLCDLCGDDPQCVRHCPEGVLGFAGLPEAERIAPLHYSEYAWTGGRCA